MDKTFAELAESIMDEFLGWDPSYAMRKVVEDRD